MFTNENWYQYLDDPMKMMIDESFYLFDQETLQGERLVDYAFIVFPLAKAYEGFLKKYLYDIGLIPQAVYESKQLRIGRSLNPDLPMKYRKESWYVDALVAYFHKSPVVEHYNLAVSIWEAWVKGRNKLFHYFPDNIETLNLEEAKTRLDEFVEVMRKCVACKTEIDKLSKTTKQ